MYAVSINGLDRNGNEHHVDIPDFDNSSKRCKLFI